MRKIIKRNKIQITPLLLILLVFSVIILIVININPILINSDTLIQNSYIPSAPIEINTDNDFLSYALPGDGSDLFPYLIENYNITTTYDSGIYIRSTSKHFIIRNCYIQSKYTAISISNVVIASARIENNTLEKSYIGLLIEDTNNVTITENNCMNNDRYGMFLIHLSGTVITENKCINNGFYGMVLDYSSGAVITDNKCMNNGLYGMCLRYSSGAVVSYNNCTNNKGYGIYMYYSNDSSITYNIFYGDGLFVYEHVISQYLTYTIQYNWVNNKLLGFYIDLDGAVISLPNYGQLIFINCKDLEISNQEISDTSVGLYLRECVDSSISNSIFTNNLVYGIYIEKSPGTTLTNNNFYGDGLYVIESSINDYLSLNIVNNYVNDKKLGFYVNLIDVEFTEPLYGQLTFINCTDITVSGQDLSNTRTSLYLSMCSNVTLINNKCDSCRSEGLVLWICSNVTITNNNFDNCGSNGINLYYSIDCELINNTCNDCGQGIFLLESTNISLFENTCSNNLFYGCDLMYCSGINMSNNFFAYNLGGVSVEYSNATLTNNTCVYNTQNGIALWYSQSCILSYNLLQENKQYGVLISGSNDNQIHHNAFVNNNMGVTPQAWDAGLNNFWYDIDSNEGNYWSDWSVADPYPIDGPAGTFDYYPLGSSPVVTIHEFQSNFSYILLFLTPLLILVIIQRKRRKN